MVHRAVLLFLLVVCLRPCLASADLVTVPDRFELARWARGSSVRCVVHLLNDSDTPVTLRDARASLRHPDLEPDASADLVTVSLPATELPAHGAIRIPLIVHTSPIIGMLREIDLEFTSDASSVVVPIRIESATGVATESTFNDPWPGSLMFLPNPMFIADVRTSDEVPAVAWLVNESDRVVEVDAVKPRCGCVGTLIARETIPPGTASRVDLRAHGSALPNDKATSVLVVTEDGTLLELPMLIRAISPEQSRVVTFQRARDIGETETARMQIVLGARVFLETRDGAGAPIRLDDDGPWAGWDRVMRAERTYHDYQGHDGEVSVIVSERNDFHRLLERAPTERLHTYRFNTGGVIESILIQRITPASTTPDRLREFLAWARSNHADEFARVFVDGSIVPGAESARTWQRLMLEWRREVDG